MLHLLRGSVHAANGTALESERAWQTLFLAAHAQQNVSAQCLEDVLNILSNPYFPVMYDAFGFSTYDLGKFDQCQQVPTAHHCVLLVPMATGAQTYMAACMPRSCAEGDVFLLLPSLANTLMPILKAQPAHNSSTVTCGDHARSIADSAAEDKGAVAMLAVLVLLGAFLLWGSLYDYLRPLGKQAQAHTHTHKLAHAQAHAQAHARAGGGGDTGAFKHASEHGPADAAGEAKEQQDGRVGRGAFCPESAAAQLKVPLLAPASSDSSSSSSSVDSAASAAAAGSSKPHKHPPVPALLSLARCFSLQRNFAALVRVQRPGPDPASGSGSTHLAALDGMRSLSLWWVIYGHTIYFAFATGMRNTARLVDTLFHAPSFQLLPQVGAARGGAGRVRSGRGARAWARARRRGRGAQGRRRRELTALLPRRALIPSTCLCRIAAPLA